MKTNFKLLLFLAVIVWTGCKNEEPGSSKKTPQMKAEEYIAQNAPFFIYNVDDFSEPKSGYAVETFSSDNDLSSVLSHVSAGDLICGSRDMLDDEYDFFCMKYFSNLDQAAEYARSNHVESGVYDLENNLPCWPWDKDEFNVGQTVSDGAVKIECMKEMYYSVTIDFTKGKSQKELGTSYGKCIKKLPIVYKTRVAAYLEGSVWIEDIEDSDEKVAALAKKLDQSDRDFLDGIVSGLGKSWPIQVDKMVYMANLLPDALRPTACSAFGVMPRMSATGKTMVCRTLDWPDVSDPTGGWLLPKGREGVVSPLQSVTKMIYSDRTIYSFGMLGIMAGVTLIDATNRNMTAILDASTGDPYNYQNRRSYVFDLATATRTCKSLGDMAKFMGQADHSYTFNHLLLMADKEKVGIFENNISNNGKKPQRAMRYWDSAVGSQFSKWEQNDLIGAVNCFMLDGQVNNYETVKALCNPKRWGQMQGKVKEILSAKPGNAKTLTIQDMQTVQSYYQGKLDSDKFDNLYNYNTLQMIQYIPEDNVAYVYVKPFTGAPAAKPTFFKLNL